MDINWVLVLGSAIVGILVGMTGAGGGALMTPMLIFFFGVTPAAAISSDLVASVFMRPVGGAVHWRKGTVNFKLVGWLALGSVPGAFLGAYILHLFGKASAKSTTNHVELVLGIALLIGASAMVGRSVLRSRSANLTKAPLAQDSNQAHDFPIRKLATLAIGAVGGVIVGLTSVGAGSLMIVALLFFYPMLSTSRLVGTDLVQAIPLTAAAGLGQLIFGHVEFAVTLLLIIGSVPAVFVGSLLSSRAPDRIIRPVIVLVLFASGLKYVGLAPDVVLTATGIASIVGLGLWAAHKKAHGSVVKESKAQKSNAPEDVLHKSASSDLSGVS